MSTTKPAALKGWNINDRVITTCEGREVFGTITSWREKFVTIALDADDAAVVGITRLWRAPSELRKVPS